MAFTLEEIATLVAEKNEEKFYKSKQWQKLRYDALKRDRFDCQRCKAKGKARRATVGHHKEELKHNPARALDIDNIESLCWWCHEEHHGRNKNLVFKKPINEERW